MSQVLLQEFAASVLPKLQQYLLDSGADGTVNISAEYAQAPLFRVGC
jgi:hypothetical protein